MNIGLHLRLKLKSNFLKMINKLIIICLLSMLAGASQLNAQKFGHLNSAVIIESHPEVGPANAQLEAYQTALIGPLDEKAKAFQAKYQAFVEEANKGTLSQVASQAKQEELQAEQKALAEEEEQIKFKVMQKREELLKPILSEVDSIIQALGKEGNYTMIFDTSVSGAVLFGEDANDLTEAVKAKIKK